LVAFPSLSLPGVLLLDSIWKRIGALFERADAVFHGRKPWRREWPHIPRTAVLREPVIVGPHMENFAAIAANSTRPALWRESGAQANWAPPCRTCWPILPGPLPWIRAQQLAMEKRGVVARVASEIWRAQRKAYPIRRIICRASLVDAAVMAVASWVTGST